MKDYVKMMLCVSKNHNKNYNLNKLLLLSILSMIFVGCKFQSQDFIDTRFIVDKKSIHDDMYISKNLDNLFNVSGYRYYEPDYVGTSFENYYVRNITIQDKSKNKYYYLLLFDRQDILRDTLHLSKDQLYSLNVEFANGKKGISIGTFDEVTSYFKINKNIELDNNVKLKPLSLNTKIINCPLPVEFLSEENAGLEDYFTFGVKDQKINSIGNFKKVENNFSIWKGNYHASFEMSRIDGDFQMDYNLNLLSKENISITEKINYENNSISGIYVALVSKDKLILKSSKDKELEYIIEKNNEHYYLMGKTIYLLNPPNDKYILTKEN